MSTKIYDAYKYTGTLDSLFQNLLEMKKQYFEYCFERLDQFGDVPAVSLKVLTGEKNWEDFLNHCIVKPDDTTKIKDIGYYDLGYFLEFVIRSQRRSPLNFEASAVVCPFKRKLYVVFFGRETPLIEESRWVDFHYQNSTDRPEEISERQWSHRRKVWDSIAERGITFGDDGLIFRFVDEDNSFNLAMDYFRKKGKLGE